MMAPIAPRTPSPVATVTDGPGFLIADVAAQLHAGPSQPQPGRTAPPAGLREQSAGWHGTVMALALPLALPLASRGEEEGGEEQARAPGEVDG